MKITNAFPEGTACFVPDGQGGNFFLCVYVCGSNVCALWTDTSAVFNTTILGSGPTLNATTRFYGIGTANLTDGSAAVAWPSNAKRIDLNTGDVTPLGDSYPFSQAGPNALFLYDRGGTPTLGAFGSGSLLLATLTGLGNAIAPTLGRWTFTALALLLIFAGAVLSTRREQLS